MIAQAAGRADDHMGALVQQPLLLARIHAADAGDDAGSGRRVEPGELALDLQREFAREGHHQRLRHGRGRKSLRDAQQRLGHGEAIGDCLAGTRLGRHQEVPT